MTHPLHLIRDTSKYKPLRPPFLRGTATPSLRLLVKYHLKKDIQRGQHDPTEDARETMNLYKLVCRQWNKRFAAATPALAGASAADSDFAPLDGVEEETEAAETAAALSAANSTNHVNRQQQVQQKQKQQQQQQETATRKKKRKRKEPHEYFL